MRIVITAFLSFVAFGAAAAPNAIQARWIGPGSCGSWTSGLTMGKADEFLPTAQNVSNGLILNWTLGFLSSDETSPLSDVDIPSVVGWLDNFCSANPLAGMPQAAFALRKEILERRGATRH